MDDQMAHELIKVLQRPQEAEYSEAFERAFELTKTYAGSASSQASAIPILFERLFELFATGSSQ